MNSAARFRILHVGEDDADRIPLMQKSGLTVERTESSLHAVADVFAEERHFSAITFQEKDFPSSLILEALRSRSAAPFVLFGNVLTNQDRSSFPGMIIAEQTPSFVWIKTLHTLIAEGTSLREQSRQLREESVAIRRESRALRGQAPELPDDASASNMTYLVTMKPRSAGVYSIIAQRVELHGEHLALVNSQGELAGLFFMGSVESLVQLANPHDAIELNRRASSH